MQGDIEKYLDYELWGEVPEGDVRPPAVSV